MRKNLLSNPMLLEVATYLFTVLVAAGLTLTHWAAPLMVEAATAQAATLVP
jgi:hypothetical protein